jgi:hypothetical protein
MTAKVGDWIAIPCNRQRQHWQHHHDHHRRPMIHDGTDPILAGTNPCDRHGPLASEYWTDLGRAAIDRLKKLTRLNPQS